MNEDRLFRPEGDERPNSRQKSGCGWKVLLIVLASMGAVSFLCCIGIGYSFYTAVPKFHRNPEIAERIFREIMSMELPEAYQPEVAITMSFFNLLKVKGVLIPGTEKKDSIAVASLKGRMAQTPEMRQVIEEAIQNRSGTDNFLVEESEEREIEIEGTKHKFLFLTGSLQDKNESGSQDPTNPVDSEAQSSQDQPEDQQVSETSEESAPAENSVSEEKPASSETTDPTSGKKLRQVRGILPVSEGAILFLYNCDEEQWNEEEAIRMIESIRLP